MLDLQQRLVRLISAEGPITIGQYMMLCLHDPQFGYYATRPALGADGDFITAPEVSQMFGEMVGVWAMSVWAQMGRPPQFRLVELGPGSGALMSDLLRAGRALPGFLEAADLWLVEASPVLRDQQTQRLAGFNSNHADRIEAIPKGAPVIVVANEFLDCLPIRQFVYSEGEGDWLERRVGLDDAGQLVLGLGPAPSGLVAPPDATEGAVFESSLAQEAVAGQLAQLVAEEGGAALLIDYGRDAPEFGDTLQALASHQKIDPLATPGQADLTAHVDFPSVAAAARGAGVEVSPIVIQGQWLRSLGVEVRAKALAQAQPDNAAVLSRQLDRLVGDEQMGRLFKVLSIHSPGLHPPGFEGPEASKSEEGRP